MNRNHPTLRKLTAAVFHGRRAPAALVLLALCAAWMGGCGSVDHVLTSIVPTGGPPEAEPRHFPDDMPRGRDYDIELVRLNRKQIRLDNRTALQYEHVTLWLNELHGDELDEVPIGRGGRIDLTRFINQHGEPFPVGSLLAPEKAKAVTTAAIEHGGELHVIPVRLSENWKRR